MPIVWTKSKVIASLSLMKPADSKKKNPHKPQRDFKSYLLFVMSAILLIFVMDEVLWDGERPYITKMKAEYYAEKAVKERAEKEAFESLLPPKVVYPETGEPYFEALPPLSPRLRGEGNGEDILRGEEDVPESTIPTEVQEPALMPSPQKRGSDVSSDKDSHFRGKSTEGKPKIAIVIDDVGMNLTQSRAAIALDPNITIAFLPYAEKVKEMAANAMSRGNEIIIHTPMEPMNGDINLGSMALRMGMNASDFNDEFLKISNSFDGYVGVNNHMGSRLTQDKQAMGQLMRLLKAQNLYFLDSRTINTSVAAETAAFYGVPYAIRDVFLDHEDTPEFVTKALAQTERTARRTGSAIAIGHPKQNTMQALQQWIPTLKKKGFELVPLSELIQKPLPITQTVKVEKVIEEKPKIEITRAVPKAQKALNFNLPE